MWTPFSLSILSLCFFTASSGVLARAIFRVFPSGAYFGSNPHLLKASLYARAEAVGALVFVTVGLILGVIAEGRTSSALSLMQAPTWLPYPNLFAAVALSVLITLLGLRASDLAIGPTVRKRLVFAKRPSWAQNGYILQHDGEYPTEENPTHSREFRDKRKESALREMEDIEALLDLPVKSSSIEDRVSRLDRIFRPRENT